MISIWAFVKIAKIFAKQIIVTAAITPKKKSTK